MIKARLFCKFFLFALNCMCVVPLQTLILLITKGPAAYILPHIWHRIVCFIFGIQIDIHGTPHTDKQTLYMCNHLSYLDIPAIASILKASFVAKSEVEGWPVFGFLSTLQQTAFIQRKRSETARQKETLQNRIRRGESLIIFPEGTSTSGFEVVPFKSSLFALAMNEEPNTLYLQPMTLQILEVNGKRPETKEGHDVYAWPRDVDIDLADHLVRFAKTSGARLKLTFHPPLKATDYKNRKVLAKACYDAVSNELINSSKQPEQQNPEG